MAKVFSITIPKNEVVLDAKRKGTATYSVTNISDQAQKGQAVIRPKLPSIAAWFSVKDPEREFPAGRSTEMTVQISIPAEAAKGTYEFELDIVREGIEPLEDRTDQGQSATFEVKDAPPPPRPPWWIFVAGGAVLVLIIAIILILSNRPVAVPNLPGMDPTQAARAISDAGLQVGSVLKAPSSDIGQGLVAFSSPAAKTELPKGGKVDLVISDGKPSVALPTLKGMNQAQATAALTSAGLNLGSISQVFDPSVPAGQVISSDPPAGQSVAPGTPVNLVVSKGPQPPTNTPTRTPTPTPLIKSLDRAPSEDTFSYPARYTCLTIKPWINPIPIIPIVPINPVSYKEEPARLITLVVPIQKLTMVPIFIATPVQLLIKCADSKSPELVLENYLDGTQFYPGVVMMRFDFGADVPADAKLTKASLKFTAASFGSGTTSMKVYVSAATNNWQIGGTSPICSAEHSTTLTLNNSGSFTADLTPLLAKYSDTIVKNGLCIQSESVGLVNLVSSEGGTATQRPLLSITYQK